MRLSPPGRRPATSWSTQPGYIDTSLHQALASDAEFQFVNVAHWASAEKFTAAICSPGMRERRPAGRRPPPPRPPLYPALHPALHPAVRT